jgi:hypothetical protein
MNRNTFTAISQSIVPFLESKRVVLDDKIYGPNEPRVKDEVIPFERLPSINWAWIFIVATTWTLLIYLSVFLIFFFRSSPIAQDHYIIYQRFTNAGRCYKMEIHTRGNTEDAIFTREIPCH